MPSHIQAVTDEVIDLATYTSSHTGDPVGINGFAYMRSTPTVLNRVRSSSHKHLDSSPLPTRGLRLGVKTKHVSS